MVTLAVQTWRTDGTTIVACRLANDADELRVALLDSRVDGPAHVAPGYRSEEATLSVPVPANATVGAGFATPAEPTEPAVELVDEQAQSSPNPNAVLADLSDPRPPHEAVVADEAPAQTNGARTQTSEAPAQTNGARTQTSEAPAQTNGARTQTGDGANQTVDADEDTETETRPMADAGTTPALDAIERRIDRLETVAAATTVPEAADALAAEGGLDSVRRLDSQVQADRDRLTALADRALTLADRAEATEPQIETLERLS